MTSRRPPVCATGTGERVVQATVGALAGAFALSNLHDPPLAIAATLGAVLLLIGAVRGWCPASLLARASARAAAPEPNTLGVPKVRQPPLER